MKVNYPVIIISAIITALIVAIFLKTVGNQWEYQKVGMRGLMGYYRTCFYDSWTSLPKRPPNAGDDSPQE